MLEARGAVDRRFPYLLHLMRRLGLDRLAARRDVLVYDVARVVPRWLAGSDDPLPDLAAADIARLRATDAVLILDNSGEGVAMGDVAFLALEGWCERGGVDAGKVVLVDQDPLSKRAAYARFAAARGSGGGLRFGFAHLWLDWTIAAAAKVPAAAVVDSVRADKPHRVLALNNAPRVHRVLAVALLAEVSPDSLVSLGVAKDARQDSTAGINRRLFAARMIAPYRRSPEFMARFGHLVEAYDPAATAARCTLPPVGRPAMFEFDVALYGRTLLSLVGETEMVRGLSRITEKSAKPALFGHPFLVAGNRGALGWLRQFGVETFPDLFDEGYDLIADPAARLAAVLAEVARLAAEPADALADRVAAVRPRLLANADALARGFRPGYLGFMARQLAQLLDGGDGPRRLGEIGPF